jgi:hypothetical protein
MINHDRVTEIFLTIFSSASDMYELMHYISVEEWGSKDIIRNAPVGTYSVMQITQYFTNVFFEYKLFESKEFKKYLLSRRPFRRELIDTLFEC